MKKITYLLVSVFGVGSMLLFASPAQAADCSGPNATPDAPACQIKKGSNATNAQTNPTSLQDQIQNIVNILLFVLGAIAVIMIVIGGIRYTTSNGDSASITSAKNTILYAVIGLVVALLAYAIVNFVLDAF